MVATGTDLRAQASCLALACLFVAQACWLSCGSQEFRASRHTEISLPSRHYCEKVWSPSMLAWLKHSGFFVCGSQEFRASCHTGISLPSRHYRSIIWSPSLALGSSTQAHSFSSLVLTFRSLWHHRASDDRALFSFLPLWGFLVNYDFR